MADGRGQLRAWRFLTVTGLLTLAFIGIACLLPDDRYVRFNSLHDPAVVKAGWIYERIHYDPTPIDVVFIGTSHTVFGVDSKQTEQDYHDATGQELHVVNFALQHLGRNVHFLLAREAIENRQVKLLVIEVLENESRSLHPAFSALANPSDFLSAPLIVNPSYLADLSRLPFRQVSLFLSTLLPEAFGAQRNFVPALYRGAHWDDTYAETGSPRYPISPVHPRVGHHTPAEMALQRQHYEQLLADSTFLSNPFPRLMRRANLFYVKEIAELARKRRVALRFLYLPSYGDPPTPVYVDTYRQFGPIWYPAEVLRDPSRWLDVNHLNHDGATALAEWLAARLSEETAPTGIARGKESGMVAKPERATGG